MAHSIKPRKNRQCSIGRRTAARKRFFWPVGASLALVTAVFRPFASGLLASSGTEEPTASYELAPDIALATATGNIQLSEHRVKVVVLYFSFLGCPMPLLLSVAPCPSSS